VTVAQENAQRKRSSPQKSRWTKRTRRNLVTGLLFISPWIIGFVIFTLYPMIVSFYTSFTIYHVRAPSEWIGLANYQEMLTDRRFWKALSNTFYMVIFAVPLTLLGSFLCAILLNMKIRGQSFFRLAYFLPSIVPLVASTILWVWLFNTNNGLINAALGRFGIDGPSWLTDPQWAKPALIIMAMWSMGSTIVIYLSGLQDVPASLMEAAELDGASWWQRLRHVTIPLVSPITLFNLILGVIAMFQYFTQAYIFAGAQSSTAASGGRTLGAPLDSTLFYSVYLYYKAFINLKFGYASAMAWILFIIIMICTVTLLRLSDRWTYYGEEA